MTHNLLLTQELPEPGMRLLATRKDVRLVVLAVPTGQALAAALPGADGVIVVMEEPALTAAMIGAASRLRVACRCGATRSTRRNGPPPGACTSWPDAGWRTRSSCSCS